jgi:hypothetical protein
VSGRRVVVPLKETVERSDAVVVAVPADPPERVIDIPIGPELPAYSRRLHRYRVEEALRGDLAPGAEIEVDRGSWGYFFAAHKLRHVDRVNKILLYEEYESTVKETEADPRRILMLKEGEGEKWEFSCGMSLEPVRMRARIEKLLGA